MLTLPTVTSQCDDFGFCYGHECAILRLPCAIRSSESRSPSVTFYNTSSASKGQPGSPVRQAPKRRRVTDGTKVSERTPVGRTSSGKPLHEHCPWKASTAIRLHRVDLGLSYMEVGVCNLSNHRHLQMTSGYLIWRSRWGVGMAGVDGRHGLALGETVLPFFRSRCHDPLGVGSIPTDASDNRCRRCSCTSTGPSGCAFEPTSCVPIPPILTVRAESSGHSSVKSAKRISVGSPG